MLGLIGGTALERLALADSRQRSVTTSWGAPSAPLTLGRLGTAQIAWLNRHGDSHSIPPHRVNYRANIAALAEQGVEGIIALNAVGGITPAMTTGSLVLPHQLIDYTWGREHSFCDTDSEPVLHVDFTDPYDRALRQRLLAAALSAGLELVDGAVHAVVQGPRLETAAEVLRLERDGCDIVGMTGMPEAGLARELGVPYASLAVVVNPAAGKSKAEITLEEIGRVMAAAAPRLLTLLEACCQ
ncbi:MAG: S-methyl-5'-thioinosine phosphorylase [Porticoccaceae bacterium]|nr:S-methyl-5'-thioinosine phosphorylase [Porticoccaceae bacterium]